MLKRIAIAFACTLPAVALACPATTPVDTARWIYTTHADFYFRGEAKAQYLSSTLRELLNKDWKCQEPGDQCAIGANPWTSAQDGDVLKPVTWKLASASDKKAVVEMSYPFGSENSEIKPVAQTTSLSLIKNPGTQCWVLDDLTGPDGTSLLQALQAFPYDGD
jgi:hypothetical protein